MAEISIIVPVYNVEKYIEKCIESICNQSFNDIEIILVNDGSTDSSKNICEDFKKKDNRIKLLNIENSGVSEARNRGLDIATGTYIMFCDSDDFLEKTWCEMLLKGIKSTGSDILISNVVRVNEDGQKSENIFSIENKTFNKYEAIRCLMSGEQPFVPSYCWNKIIKKQVFEEIRFKSNLKFMEDDEIFSRLYLNCNKISYMGETYYNYLIRENSLTQEIQHNMELSLNALKAHSQCLENINHVYPDLCKLSYFKQINICYNSICRMIMLNKENSRYFNEFILHLKSLLPYIFRNKHFTIKNRVMIYLVLISKKLFKFVYIIYSRNG